MTIYDLGFDVFLNKKPLFSEAPVAAQSNYSQGVSASVIQSGQTTANLSLVAGFLQSSNYFTGIQGWRINAAGDIEANNGTFRGTLYASSGQIGGFTITSTKLYGGKIQTGENVEIGESGVIMDSDGLRGYSTTLGQVFNIPTDGSAPSFSSGIIESTIFEINTNSILRTSSTVGDGSANSAGILINDTGLYACEANQLLEDANIKILIDGSGVFNANVRGGQTDFNTGTGYFLGLSAGAYKLSIGNPSGNFMTWDGTYLRLRGSFDVGTGGLINNSSYTVANLPTAPTTVGFNVPNAYE